MSRYMSVVWVFQFIALMFMGCLVLFAPEIVPKVLDNCAVEFNPEVDKDVSHVLAGCFTDATDDAHKHITLRVKPTQGDWPQDPKKRPASLSELRLIQSSVQLLSPLLFTLALFSLWGFMRQAQRARQQLAQIFFVTSFWLMFDLSQILYMQRDRNLFTFDSRIGSWDAFTARIGEQGPWVFLWMLGLLGLLVSNGLYAFWPLPRGERSLSGSADTRPSGLWLLWLVQGLSFSAFAIYLEAQTSSLPRFIESYDAYFYGKVVYHSQRFFAPLIAAMGLLSFSAMRASREWNWRTFSRLFVIFYGLWFTLLLFTWQASFNGWMLLTQLPLVVGMGYNYRFWHQTDVSFAEQVGHGPDGWLPVDLLVGPLLLLHTLFTRKRALFERGAGAWGTFKTEDFPYTLSRQLAHDFFLPNHAFTVRARFSTDGEDDAGLAARGVALQLSSPRTGTFELLLSTGAYSATENIVQFALLRLARGMGTFAQSRLWSAYPRMREGMVAALRRAPDSYSQLHYSSQTVRFWVCPDGVRYLVRYRLVPHSDGMPESGIPEAHENEPLAFKFRRLPGERRPTDYLKQELRRRLEGPRTVPMRLEAQYHHPEPGDNNHWYNPAADWSTDEHPWIRLGVVQLEDVLPDVEAEQLTFNPANVPPSLGTPQSPGPLDYRSLADSEKRVHLRLQETRTWMTSMWGLPPLDPKPWDPT